MGKSFSTADMIGATTPKKSTSHLVDQASSSPVVAVPRDDASAPLESVERFAKTAVFLKPDQRQWLKDTVKHLPVDGLSASDLVRLAVDRLRSEFEGEGELLEALTSQAHADAERFAGRRNRGLPPRVG